MANLKVSIALFVAVAGLSVIASQNLIAPRIIGGVPIDTLRRFPHHVTIEPIAYYSDNGLKKCAGSILNDQWVLTSARCVDSIERLQLHFEKLYENSTVGSYSAVVNSDAVHIYPTYYDDIALVKIPFRLIFSDTIKPVSISSTPVAQLQNKLVVLPGFDNNGRSDQLTYAMLSVQSNSVCKGLDQFDEFLQLCTKGYGNNANNPCFTDSGSGLLNGWPAKSELIGIYSGSWYSYDCASNSPAVYTNVAKYASWIQSIISS